MTSLKDFKLSPAQKSAIAEAKKRPDFAIEPLPKHLPSGARQKIKRALLNKGLIVYIDELEKEVLSPICFVEEIEATVKSNFESQTKDNTSLFAESDANDSITSETQPEEPSPINEPKEQIEEPKMIESDIAQSKTKSEADKLPKQPRPGSKSAKLLELISQPDGADTETLMEAVGWQKHSVRGHISTLKKNGHNIQTKQMGDSKNYILIMQDD